ncbi:hypothetical protein MP638_005953 [Amoeboaphelidium occidentale]|nr:hypothetical protein MP638_005953 [Amoeboaphelidium occidentale]
MAKDGYEDIDLYSFNYSEDAGIIRSNNIGGRRAPVKYSQKFWIGVAVAVVTTILTILITITVVLDPFAQSECTPCVSNDLMAVVQKDCLCGRSKVREYYLTIDWVLVDGMVSGQKRRLIGINSTSPGPTIQAYKAETVIVTVKNRLDVETALHWHGMSQRNSTDMDGAPGITQCPIPPGETMVYQFTAEDSGTYFYHGHMPDQYPNGLYGALIIHDPVEQYEYLDEFVFIIGDYYNIEPKSLIENFYLTLISKGMEPIPNAIIVNNERIGPYNIPRSIVRGNSRVRIISAAALSMHELSFGDYSVNIIEIDGTAIEPFSVNQLQINAAQRISFLVDWTQWNNFHMKVRAMHEEYDVNIDDYISQYDLPGTPKLNPVYYVSILEENSLDDTGYIEPTGSIVLPRDTNMIDAIPLNSQPLTAKPNKLLYINMTFKTGPEGYERGYFNGISMNRKMVNRNPPLILDRKNVTSQNITAKIEPSHMVAHLNLENLPIIQATEESHYRVSRGDIVEVLIENMDDGAHPIHFHGHKFYVISSSEFPEAEEANEGTFIKRDVVSVPANGWARLRLIADNPGLWAVHCHIEWHLSAGLMIVLEVEPSAIILKNEQQAKRLCRIK